MRAFRLYFVAFYRRRLPHIYEIGQPVFVTWRLNGSLAPNRSFPANSLTSGQAFAAADRLLAEARSGPFYLRMPAIAQMVIDTVRRGGDEFNQYALHAFVVMPNHVHLLLTLAISLPRITGSIKSVTGRCANEMLHLKGPFWQKESYDHLVRSSYEFERIRRYIEYNPVAAGLAKQPSDFRWSSAYKPAVS